MTCYLTCLSLCLHLRDYCVYRIGLSVIGRTFFLFKAVFLFWLTFCLFYWLVVTSFFFFFLFWLLNGSCLHCLCFSRTCSSYNLVILVAECRSHCIFALHQVTCRTMGRQRKAPLFAASFLNK